jgi:PAS domain-containing protein
MMPPGVGASSAAAALLRTLWAAATPATLQGVDHRLLDVNDAYAALVGQTRQALVGRDPIDLQPATTAPSATSSASRACTTATLKTRCNAAWWTPRVASAGFMSR